MKRKIFKLHFVLLILAQLFLSSCDEQLEEVPLDKFSSDNFFQSKSDVEAYVYGFYPQLKQFVTGPFDSRLFHFLEGGADDVFIGVNRSNQAEQELGIGVIAVENGIVYETWTRFYSTLNRVNGLIELLPTFAFLGENDQKQYMSEAKYIRAFIYFHIVRLWGDALMPLLPTKTQHDFLAKTPASEIYSQIIADLEEVESLNALPQSEWPGGGKERPTMGAVKMVLADVYMTMAGYPINDNSKWNDALTRIDQLMTMNYSLQGNYEDIFDVDNLFGDEAIVEFTYDISLDNGLGSQLQFLSFYKGPGSNKTRFGWGNCFNGTRSLASHFEEGDLRRIMLKDSVLWEENWISLQNPTIYKYVDKHNYGLGVKVNRTNNNLRLYRFADVLLRKAEIENEINGPGQAAYDAINNVRQRAGLEPLSGLSKEEFKLALIKERRSELFMELKRWFDLKRWHILAETVNGTLMDPLLDTRIKTISEKNYLFPIPFLEMEANPLITENNPGY